MKLRCPWIWAVGVPLLLWLPSACAPHKKMTVAAAATLLESVAEASYKQSDLGVIREGMPAYLMLMDGMIEAWPENERLLIAAAQAYASYATAFGEELDEADVGALLSRARFYALQALALRGLSEPPQMAFDRFQERLQDLGRKDVPYLFWSASCWGNWIVHNMNSMEAVAELPRVELLMRRVLELEEGFYYGGPHLFMGMWYASRPPVAGGDLDKARGHFEKAIALGRGRFLMAQVYYAQYYARRAFERELFTTILEDTLKTPADVEPQLTLLNTVAHKKARALLERVDEFF
jgi:hypothetical protein